jgi:hypothetical protein
MLRALRLRSMIPSEMNFIFFLCTLSFFGNSEETIISKHPTFNTS